MKIILTGKQKVFMVAMFFIAAIVGFMIKLPTAFRHMDKELHAAFYFLAAAFLNIVFARINLIRHVIIFVALYLFGMAIEYGQAYSNQFFRSRIHGRFDPGDVQSNVKGLFAFSMVWLICAAIALLYNKVSSKHKT